jgi:hypothetical protein
MTGKSFLEKYFVLFLYVSLLFLVVYLVRYDYVALDVGSLNCGYLGLSFLFLFFGFFVHALCWYGVCKRSVKHVALSTAIASHGLSIFGKYIPGKVWAIVGRATYLSRIGVALTTTAQLSLYTLLLSIWAGMVMGIAGLVFVDRMSVYLPGMALLWVLLSVLLFAPVHKMAWIGAVMERVNRENFPLARLHAADHLRTIPLFFLFWLSWSIGFLFLVYALFPHTVHGLSTGLAFPFATTIGIMAFFFPGGLGVREGCLVLYLVKSGMPLEDATSISIAARGWFIVGEVFIFLTALVLNVGVTKET